MISGASLKRFNFKLLKISRELRFILYSISVSETSRARNELQRSPVFMDLYREMEALFLNPTKGTLS